MISGALLNFCFNKKSSFEEWASYSPNHIIKNMCGSRASYTNIFISQPTKLTKIPSFSTRFFQNGTILNFHT